MESKFTPEDIAGLRAMDISESDIQKLLSLDSKQLAKLMRSAVPKPSGLPRPKKRKSGDYHISYMIICDLCGYKSFRQITGVCKKEYAGMNTFYKTGKGVVSTDRCSHCEDYLNGLSREELVKIVMNSKYKSYEEKAEFRDNFPVIEEVFEAKLYPIVVYDDCPFSDVHAMNGTWKHGGELWQ